MKNFVLFIFSFFISISCFAQSMEKKYFDNNQDVGGDAVIKSSNVKIENDEIYKTFEIECSGAGAYYLDAWITAPFTKEGYSEYRVDVNGISSGFSFKPQNSEWHSLALTDTKKTVAAVNLNKGINTISIIGKGPEIPNVEFVKLSSSLNRTGISDSKYRQFVESIQSGTLNEVYNSGSQQVNSNRGTNGEIYDYYLDISASYTTLKPFYFTSGQSVNIKTDRVSVSSSINPVIEFFSMNKPLLYSWSSLTSSGDGILNITIPETDCYYLCIRIPPSGNIFYNGIVNLTVNSWFYSNCVVLSSINTPVTVSCPPPANFFTCQIKNNGSTWMMLEDNLGKICGFNDYVNLTSDGYSWGNASRITLETNSTPINVSRGHVFSNSSYNPVVECDLYMGLKSINYNDSVYIHKNNFPYLHPDNSFRSGPYTCKPDTGYNCFDWSVGIYTEPCEYVSTNWNSFIFESACDKFYKSYGYTDLGADSTNAVIALWMNGGNITHASVRKHSMNPNPHGFEWESKCGAWERVMHTRDAVANDVNMLYAYGRIKKYYRPDPTRTGNNIRPGPESSFSALDLDRITILKNLVPNAVLSGFDKKYQTWKKTWSRPEFAIHSNIYMYAQSPEYEDLLSFCLKYKKAIWPVLFDNLAREGVFVANLLKDVTYKGELHFENYIMSSITTDRPFTLYSVLVKYCNELLEMEEVNIHKSILELSFGEEKTLNLIKQTDTLYIKGSKNVRFEEDGVFHNSFTAHLLPPEDFLFTGEDILSYDLSTETIVFTDSVRYMLLYDSKAIIWNIYLNDKLLLENIIPMSGASSFIIYDLVLYLTDGPTFYLCYLIPGWKDRLIDIESKPEEEREHILAVKELLDTKAEIRKEGWDIFIQYLKDTGKLVENTTSIEKITAPEFNSVSIYPNPTTGELRIKNGEWRIMNIQIFDIIGNKVSTLAPYSLSSKVDISHLPAGIYFVQITTEKGVVTKKVVKR